MSDKLRELAKHIAEECINYRSSCYGTKRWDENAMHLLYHAADVLQQMAALSQGEGQAERPQLSEEQVREIVQETIRVGLIPIHKAGGMEQVLKAALLTGAEKEQP